MNIRRIWTLTGPNMWTRAPALEVWLELDEHRDWRSNQGPHFAQRLLDWLPGLAANPGRNGQGWASDLQAGVTLADAIQNVAVYLQNRCGAPVPHGQTAPVTVEPGVHRLIIPFDDTTVVNACLDAAQNICLAALRDQDFDITAEIERLTEVVDRNRWGRATAAVETAARKRNIPVEHLNPNDGRLMALGWGAKQRWVMAAQTDKTSDLGQAVSQDKELTKSLLRTIGVPVPEGRPVTDAADAWRAAQELGGPVVIKPRDRDLSVGIRVNLSTEQQVLEAYQYARTKSDDILVERYAPGYPQRLFIVNGQVVAAACTEPPLVVGDGKTTIRDLVARTNAEPDRGDGYSTPKAKINLDDLTVDALTFQGYTLESVPPAGARVILRYHPPLFEAGGAILDVTDRVHPELAERVTEAVKLIGLDVAGVDLVCEDVGRPLEAQAGVVLEVNAGPALWLHMEPWCKPPRPVAEAIVASVIPEGQNGRIPLVAVTGVNGKTTTSYLVKHLLTMAGRQVGMACTEGLFIKGRRISDRDCSGPQSAKSALRHPAVDAVVLETARGGILRQGLGFDFCDVGIVTNIGEGDHLGLRGIHTREELALVKGTVVQAVAPNGHAVLNAHDPLVVQMAAQCSGQVVYFARDEQEPVVVAHRQGGGKAAFVRDGVVHFADGNAVIPVLPLAEIPMTVQGRVGFQVENALAGAAAAWQIGCPLDTIRAGLKTFATGGINAPGRFNVFTLRDATVIVDYAHNASALVALCEAATGLPQNHRSVVYCGYDRRDEDVIRQGEILGAAFDRILLFRDYDNHERADGELTKLVEQGVASRHRNTEVIEFDSEEQAIAAGLNSLTPGDLLVIGCESIAKALAAVAAAK